MIVPWVWHRNGERIRSIRRAWEGACKRAGLAEFRLHDLRRTAVRNLERAGVSRSVATRLTGHKTEHVCARYAITDSTSLAEGFGKLAAAHEREPRERDVVPFRPGTGTDPAQSAGRKQANA